MSDSASSAGSSDATRIACRGIVFDLDGTLIDSLADIASAANEVLQSAGFPAHPLASFRTFVGDGVRTLFERALPAEIRTPEIINRCAAGFSASYARTWNVQTRLYPGISELLDELTARGVRLAVLSNKPDPFTRQMMQHFCGSWPFEVVAGQRENVPRKPSPVGAVQIAVELKLPVGDLAFVGDSSVDVITGREAGMVPIGVSWGFRPISELWEHGAVAVIDRPADLLAFIAN